MPHPAHESYSSARPNKVCPISWMAVATKPGAVENLAIAPPAPPDIEELTRTRIRCHSLNCLLTTLLTRPSSTEMSRRMPETQNVASKYVITCAPDPVLPSAQVAGSSAPDCVDATSNRNTLKTRLKLLKGGTVVRPFTNCWAWVAKRPN